MRAVDLFDACGTFVARVEIPPFSDAGMPRVIVWGARTFVCADTKAGHRYREAFAFVSLTPSPGLPRDAAP